MSDAAGAGEAQKYDRELLLFGQQRNQVLQLWEVQRYGIDSFGDPDHVSIFAMRPPDWYARGIRLLGRTAVECTRDGLGDAIGKGIAALGAPRLAIAGVQVLDPFLGSANTLYWILRHLPGALGLGVELDQNVCALTKQNLTAASISIEVVNADYQSALTNLTVPADVRVIAFVSPPWGNAFSEATGLDLGSTVPPILDVVRFLIRRFGRNSLLCAIQILEGADAVSVDEVRAAFDWSAVWLFDLNSSYGLRPGMLVGTTGWVPRLVPWSIGV